MVPGVYVLTSCAVPLNETSNPAAINPFFHISIFYHICKQI